MPSNTQIKKQRRERIEKIIIISCTSYNPMFPKSVWFSILLHDVFPGCRQHLRAKTRIYLPSRLLVDFVVACGIT